MLHIFYFLEFLIITLRMNDKISEAVEYLLEACNTLTIQIYLKLIEHS